MAEVTDAADVAEASMGGAVSDTGVAAGVVEADAGSSVSVLASGNRN